MNARSWRVVGASVQGTSHAATGLPCQDAHLYRVLPGDRLVLAVADGAGSASHAAEAAQQCVLVAVASLAASLGDTLPTDQGGWENVVTATYGDARAALGQLASAAGLPLREFATTLTCVVVAEPWLVVAQIGDGLVVVQSATDELSLAARPQRGEYANEAFFLTMDAALDYVDIRACQQAVQAVAASTDGLLRLALRLPAYEPHAPFFDPLLAFAGQAALDGTAEAQLVHFLDSARVCARTDDDKTLVVAVRAPAFGASGEKNPLGLMAPEGEEDLYR